MPTKRDRLIARAKRHAWHLLEQDSQSLLRQHELTAAQRVFLRRDLDILIGAGRRRLSASCAISGASRRRATQLRDLLHAAAQIRAQVRAQFRGPAHAEVRRAFGTGHVVGESKNVAKVVALAEQVLAAAQAHPEALRAAGVWPQQVRQVKRLLAQVLAPERAALLAQRRDMIDEVMAAAERILAVDPHWAESPSRLRPCPGCEDCRGYDEGMGQIHCGGGGVLSVRGRRP
jgi:hypothetical protein